MFASKASRLTVQAQKIVQQSTRNTTVLSGPPTVKISHAERFLHGIVMTAGFTAIPIWVLVNIKNYRANEE